MPECPYDDCAHLNPSKARFCGGCGRKLKGAVPTEPEAAKLLGKSPLRKAAGHYVPLGFFDLLVILLVALLGVFLIVAMLEH